MRYIRCTHNMSKKYNSKGYLIILSGMGMGRGKAMEGH